MKRSFTKRLKRKKTRRLKGGATPTKLSAAIKNKILERSQMTPKEVFDYENYLLQVKKAKRFTQANSILDAIKEPDSETMEPLLERQFKKPTAVDYLKEAYHHDKPPKTSVFRHLLNTPLKPMEPMGSLSKKRLTATDYLRESYYVDKPQGANENFKA